MKKIMAILLLAMLVFSGCTQKTDFTSDETTKNETQTENVQTQKEEPVFEAPTEAAITDTVEIKMQNGGVITVGLCREYAPETVENFLKLAESGFYDGLTFHRVISGFMIQGGDPEGTGMGGSDKEIKGEFAANGFEKNTIAHVRGVISMARANDPDSASSQFFIMHQDAPYLDGNYAAFGFVTSGMEVVDEIAMSETDQNDKPITPVVIESIKVIGAK